VVVSINADCQDFITTLKRKMDRIHPDDQLKVVRYAAKLTQIRERELRRLEKLKTDPESVAVLDQRMKDLRHKRTLKNK